MPQPQLTLLALIPQGFMRRGKREGVCLMKMFKQN